MFASPKDCRVEEVWPRSSLRCGDVVVSSTYGDEAKVAGGISVESTTRGRQSTPINLLRSLHAHRFR